MSALSRNYWDTVAAPGVVFSAGGVTNNLSAVTFSNSNGVSFGLNAGVITASAVGGGGGGSLNVSAGTLSSNVSAITFSNANGVSFGFDGSNITATVKTNYAGQGFTSTTTAGTAVVGTLSTNGISLGIPVFLTTAMQSNAATISNINVSAGATSANLSNITFSNSNGVAFGLTNSVITVSYTVPTVTNSSWTVSDTATSATVGRLAFTAANGITMTLSTSNNGNHTVFASYTVPTVTNSAWTVSDSATSVTVARLMFSNANGVSFGLITSNNGSQSVTASIATTYAGTGFTSTTTAGTAIVGTLNTSGLSLGVPAFITTAALSSQTMVFSNSQTFYSTGTLAISEGGGAITIATSAGGQSFKFSVPQTSSLVGTSGISVSTNGSTISIYAASSYLTTAAQSSALMSYWANLPALEATSTTMCQSNSFYVFPITVDNNMSISYARLLASFNFTSTSIATSAVNNATGASTAFSETLAFNILLYTAGTGGSSRSLQEVYSTSAGMTWAASVSQASTSNATNQSITQIITYPSLGFTTATASTQYSVSTTLGPISTTQWSNLSAQRFLDIPFATSLSAGNYWVALNRFSGTVGGKNMDVNATTFGISQQNLSFADMNVATNLTNCAPQYGLGLWTQANASTSASIGFANVSATTSYMIPMLQFIRQA